MELVLYNKLSNSMIYSKINIIKIKEKCEELNIDKFCYTEQTLIQMASIIL
jgi:hypothetical protein